MKKIVRGIALGFLVLAVVLAVTVWRVFFYSSEKPPAAFLPTVTDVNGNAYAVVDGDDGNKYIVVTDEQSNVYAAATNADGTPASTVGQINSQVSIDQLPQNNDGPKIDDTVTGNFQGNVVDNTTTAAEQTTTAPQQSQQQSTTAADNGDSSQQSKYKISRYQQMFASNCYLMEFKTQDDELGEMPATFAVKGGNFAMETQIEGINCKMLYLKAKDSTYMVLDQMKKYCKVPEDMFGEDLDMSQASFMQEVDPEQYDEKITVSEVTIDGQKLTCESYVDDSGVTTKYYFSGDTLVRFDSVQTDGTVDTTLVTRITSEVPDSYFEIPSNYGFINLSWLSALTGISSNS